MNERRTLGQRVTEVEKEVAVARKDANAARALASGADRDVSDVHEKLIAHTKALNALRETQLEQGEAMREGFAKVDARFAKVDARFARVDEGFAKLGKGQEQITRLLTAHLPRSDEAG